MHFKQFYVGCLAHASYLIGDRGVAAVVDPARDVDMYMEEARTHGLEIRWVLETHLHADFVSGHRELAERTGATIGIGAKAEAGYAHRPLRDGDEIPLGGALIRVLETPGHTPESVSFVVYAEAGDPEPWGVLTGDTLFVGDVGRVDILSSRLPVIELAGMMYDSLHRKLLALPDVTRVYPAHGAGSLCGRSMSSESSSTIGRERQMNPALADHGREAFVADVTRDVPETPIYFLHSRDLNRTGPRLDAQRPMPRELDAKEFAAAAAVGGVILDTRATAAFGVCHPAGALHASLDGQFASWVGTLVAPDVPLLLVVEPDRAEEAVMRLARVGYERVEGLLRGGCDAWQRAGLPTAAVPQLPAESLASGARAVLDVRRQREWDAGHLAGATHVPLAQLRERLGELERDADWAVICASGYRSGIAASIMLAAGFPRVANAVGGMDACRRAGLPLAAANSVSA